MANNNDAYEETGSGDRDVNHYHFIRSSEVWSGFVFSVPLPRAVKAKQDIDTILDRHHHEQAMRKGKQIYAGGPYTSDVVRELRRYARLHDYSFEVVRSKNPRTSYLEFVGDWLLARQVPLDEICK